MNTESPSLSDLLNNQTRRPGYAHRYISRFSPTEVTFVDRGTRLERNQPVIVLNDDAEFGQTVGYYGTIDRILSQSFIRYPDAPQRWRYFVHVPYLRGRVNAPRRLLYAMDAPVHPKQHLGIDWKIEYDTPLKPGIGIVFGSFQLPDVGCTHFLFEKRDVQTLTCKFAKAISGQTDTARLHCILPETVELDTEFVLRAIRDLTGYPKTPESDNNVTKA